MKTSREIIRLALAKAVMAATARQGEAAITATVRPIPKVCDPSAMIVGMR